MKFSLFTWTFVFASINMEHPFCFLKKKIELIFLMELKMCECECECAVGMRYVFCGFFMVTLNTFLFRAYLSITSYYVLFFRFSILRPPLIHYIFYFGHTITTFATLKHFIHWTDALWHNSIMERMWCDAKIEIEN